MRFRPSIAIAGVLLLLIALQAPVTAAVAPRTRVEELASALAAEQHGGVFDFAHLLKPGGIRELQELASQFEAKGRRVWFVTIPRDENAQAVAEALYDRLGMEAHDLLIVFNGQQVYGKTLALKGQPEAFRQAFEAAQPAFHQYWGKGLAEYARQLEARIEARAGESTLPPRDTGSQAAPGGPSAAEPGASPQAAPPEPAHAGRMALIGLLLVLLAAGLGFGLSRYPRVAAQGRVYQTRLGEATNLLSEAAMEADRHPVRDHDARLAEMSERLEELRRSPQREDTRAVDLLISDARSLLVDVRKKGA